MAPEAPARRVLSLCRLYAGMRAIGVTLQEALLQKPPVIWRKDQFAVDPRSLETCHERSLPIY